MTVHTHSPRAAPSGATPEQETDSPTGDCSGESFPCDSLCTDPEYCRFAGCEVRAAAGIWNAGWTL